MRTHTIATATNWTKGRKLSVLLASMVLIQLVAILPLAAQTLDEYKGDSLNRAGNIMSGNKVSTLFYNYGLASRASTDESPSGEWPTGTGNEYVGDVSPLIAVEYVHTSGDTVHTVITVDGPRGNTDDNADGSSAVFEPLPGFAADPLPGEDALAAISTDSDTWPDFWPDKYLDDNRDQLWARDTNDPGWPGAWNGYFGKDKFSADQETYFIVDDNWDREFQTLTLKTETGADSLDGEGNPIRVTYYPTALDQDRGGIGIRMGVRGFQWAHFLAEDCIFWHYEITNISDYNYNRVNFGMVVGTLVGGSGDSEDDLAFFDPDNNITYSYDSDGVGTTGWQGIVGYIGYAFLESPGNPYDGIDNDNDSESTTSPVLTETILTEMAVDGIIYSAGDDICVIDYSAFGDSTYYSDPMRGRTIVELPAEGLEISQNGHTTMIYPNVRYIEDGGNGLDDNFNGLIDERIGEEVGGKRLDHVGLKYMNFFTGEGLDDLMIDEARDDGIDNDGDWDVATDDVGFDGVAGSGDTGEGDGIPTNGEPHFDKTDVDESDQIGLTSFDYFSPPGALRMNDDNGNVLNGTGGIWGRMEPGTIDVIPGEAEDGDFLYGSGYFPLPSGKTERFSIALLFGEDYEDITNNKQTVQQIYDNNYVFVKPPDKPTLKAVASDGKVTLYWDDIAEDSYDDSMPLGEEEDFEGYKIYRATDYAFLENYTITDGKGRKTFHSPIAQYDLDNGNAGYFPEASYGVSFYLGDDTGLQHVWTDTTVQNGQTYYYAVTSYDHGYTGIIDESEAVFFPAECSKVITVDTDGNENFDINTVKVTPTTPAAGYESATATEALHMSGTGDGVVYCEIVDETLVEDGRAYSIIFEDLDEDLIAQTAHILRTDTNDTLLTMDMANYGYEIRILDRFNSYFEELFSSTGYETMTGFHSVESTILDGQRIYIIPPHRPGDKVLSLTRWTSSNDNSDSLLAFNASLFESAPLGIYGVPDYRNYQVIFSEDDIGTTTEYQVSTRLFEAAPTNCIIKDIDTGEDIPFFIIGVTSSNDNRWNANNESIVMLNVYENAEGVVDTALSWKVVAGYSLANGTIFAPTDGDTINVHMYRPFTEEDVFVWETEAATINSRDVDLDQIKVYPNPYLAVSTQESNNTYISGRGERRVNFIHLPGTCTIRIYTVRGELIRTIEHNGGLMDGSAVWDLRTKDGLDVSYGIYIYHVESTYGDHIGKFAVVK